MNEFWMTTQFSAKRESVELRHHHVKEYNVRQDALNHGQALLVVRGLLDLKAGLAKRAAIRTIRRGRLVNGSDQDMPRLHQY